MIYTDSASVFITFKRFLAAHCLFCRPESCIEIDRTRFPWAECKFFALAESTWLSFFGSFSLCGFDWLPRQPQFALNRLLIKWSQWLAKRTSSKEQEKPHKRPLKREYFIWFVHSRRRAAAIWMAVLDTEGVWSAERGFWSYNHALLQKFWSRSIDEWTSGGEHQRFDQRQSAFVEENERFGILIGCSEESRSLWKMRENPLKSTQTTKNTITKWKKNQQHK